MTESRYLDPEDEAFNEIERQATYFTGKHAVSMELRDYFAAKAMHAFISGWIGCSDYPETDMVVAEHAYSMADVMLKAREA